jgi:hypothetical protein
MDSKTSWKKVLKAVAIPVLGLVGVIAAVTTAGVGSAVKKEVRRTGGGWKKEK